MPYSDGLLPEVLYDAHGRGRRSIHTLWTTSCKVLRRRDVLQVLLFSDSHSSASCRDNRFRPACYALSTSMLLTRFFMLCPIHPVAVYDNLEIFQIMRGYALIVPNPHEGVHGKEESSAALRSFPQHSAQIWLW